MAQTIKAKYLVGGDGPRSLVRQRLGWRYSGETGVTRDFAGGPHGRGLCPHPRLLPRDRHKPAWMNVNFNRERRCFMPAVDGKEQFAFHTQLKPHEDETASRTARPSRWCSRRSARRSRSSPGASRVDRRPFAGRGALGAGRVFIGGDAAHLFTPTGGLGYTPRSRTP